MTQEERILKTKEFLEEQINNLDSRGGVLKLGELQETSIKDLENVIFDYPELEYYVLENTDSYDVFLRYKSLDTKIDIGKIIESAKEAYIKGKTKASIYKLLLVLRKASHPKSEVYSLIGLSYISLNEQEKGIDYLRLANYLDGKKDYNNVDIDEVRERVEKEMKNYKKNSYNQYSVNSNKEIHIDKLTLPNLDEIIEYMEEKHIDIETAGKEFNLTNEEIDFIKLIYAREFYKQGDMEKGNYYLKSVEESCGKTNDVTRLCLEARTNKKFFQYRDNNQPKNLSLVKTRRRK